MSKKSKKSKKKKKNKGKKKKKDKDQKKKKSKKKSNKKSKKSKKSKKKSKKKKSKKDSKKEEKKDNKDTGSTKAQIVSLNKEIKNLTKHLQRNIHDHSSRRGLIKKINKRRKLLKYLKVNDPELHEKMVSKIKNKDKDKE